MALMDRADTGAKDLDAAHLCTVHVCIHTGGGHVPSGEGADVDSKNKMDFLHYACMDGLTDGPWPHGDTGAVWNSKG
jgi:hypothetical protein